MNGFFIDEDGRAIGIAPEWTPTVWVESVEHSELNEVELKNFDSSKVEGFLGLNINKVSYLIKSEIEVLQPEGTAYPNDFKDILSNMSGDPTKRNIYFFEDNKVTKIEPDKEARDYAKSLNKKI